MISKNIKVFIKQLSKNKRYSLVTIFGFSVSLMFIVLISAYLKLETSVDKFHENKDRLFRLVNEGDSRFGATIGSRLSDALPEIESFTRVFYYNQYCAPVNSGSDKNMNANILMVDSAFFNMFSFKLLEGLPNEVLSAKNSILLTPKFARALFGDISKVGKQIKSSDGTILQVTGIIEEMPENTQFKKFDAIANIHSLPDFIGYKVVLDNDNKCDFTYYVLAKNSTNILAKEEQALGILKNDLWIYKDGRVKTFGFEPIIESYFSDISGDIRQNSKTLISVLLAIVLIILLLSIINYVNLTIAQSGFRNKEVAIRKLMGNSRIALIIDHVTESVMFSFIAAIIGVFLAFMAEPVFNKLLDTHIDLFHNTKLTELLIVVIAMFTIGLISGLFPALLLTKLKPVEVLKGSFRTKAKTSYSKALVSFQFAATIALIVCATTITKQTHYMQNFNMGFKKDNIVQIDKNFPKEKRQAFNDLLKQIPGVEQVSFVCGTPLNGGNNQSFTYNGIPVSFQEFFVDTAFFSMMGIRYTPTGVAWADNVLWLNLNAIKELGLDPLPKSFKRYYEERPVYGVVEDFHFRDLRQAVGLAMLSPLKDKDWSWNVLIKISNENIAGTMAQIKSAYSSFTNGEPFDCRFLDSEIDNWYRKEASTSKIIAWFSFLTIIISVMGILALVTLFNQLRIREIGIRKVNGAHIIEVMAILNKDLVTWVAVAFVIACPIAYYAMHKWLENFAYKTELSWWIFALAGVLALGIALLTVSWQSWRAATRNPVEALRYE